MKTKNIKKILLAATVCCGFVATAPLTSCSSWIDEDTSTLMTTGDSRDDADAWLTGVYSKWIVDIFCWGYFPRVLELDADYVAGPDWYFGTFGSGNFQGESDVTDALWKGCYGLIERSNTAQRHIEAMTSLTEDEKNNYIGELKFQRAFCYFLLVRAYGDVPIQSEDETSQLSRPRESVVKVYDYIERLLEEAAGQMYKNTDSRYQAGHVCAGSAAGLLAKVYATEASSALQTSDKITVRTGTAYDGDGSDRMYAPLQSFELTKNVVKGYEGLDAKALYTQAAKWAKAVVDGDYGTYELLPYDDLWKKSSATASEFMFSIGSVSGDATYKNAIYTTYEGVFQGESEFIGDGQYLGCTRHWYDLFEPTDLRIVKGVKHRWRNTSHQATNNGFFYPLTNEYSIMATGKDLNGQTVGDGNPTGIYADGVSYYYNKTSECLAFTTKYADVTNPSIKDADANWPFLRLADVLLVYAEALNELGQAQPSLDELNKVRRRSQATEAVLSGNGALDTQAKRRSAIIEERAKELACEADRRWDLIRWGIYLDAMNAVGTDDAGNSKVRSERNLLFPIPQPEINTNAEITANNPGWN